jgi:hypothetical protein
MATEEKKRNVELDMQTALVRTQFLTSVLGSEHSSHFQDKVMPNSGIIHPIISSSFINCTK